MEGILTVFAALVKNTNNFYFAELVRGYCDNRCVLCRKCENDRDLIRPVKDYEADFLENYVLNHQVRVAGLCVKAAEKLGLEIKKGSHLIQAALLHDIGKLSVPFNILCKNGPLTEEEYEIIKLHACEGALWLKRRGFPREVVETVRYHHERYDGKGYPEGLRGENIPYLSRILAVCDAADAMIYSRPYGRLLEVEGAAAEIKRNSGSQFDPEIADAVTVILREGAVYSV